MADIEASDTPSSHATTTGMTGGGFYDANSATQWNAIEAVLPILDDAITSLQLRDPDCVRLADFGCSEGRNSIAVMSRALRSLLPKTDLSVQTIHSDLPTNDFSKLIANLRPDGQSVYDSNRVYSSVVGGSMYDQLLPERSLHLATTFNAIGFLSRRPVNRLPGYIFPNGPSTVRANGYVSDDDRSAFALQARRDVECYLEVRARELVPGGKLLVQVFGSTDQARTCDGIYDLLNDAVLSFVDKDEISRESYDRYYQPVYMRHLDELTAPLRDPQSTVSSLYSLDSTRSYEIAVPFNQQYASDGDLDRFAKDYVNFFRAFTEAVLSSALPETPERADLVDRIYRQAEVILKANPKSYPFRYMAIAMLLTRKD
ncbi:MAG: class I SAM-dependent methyltransferase [Roseibium sp.]|uniref:hypothetical protein n=1 Tax=Roseibium sp. TaxID=1936156 RepID=UPI00262D9F65|nr:hypothetical protein [Roseibium sp.]MCV0424020.1 class I SAM-dependent methyltransferase [Roseibium sp.]